eukprot:108197-Rhodomonas_salina.2
MAALAPGQSLLDPFCGGTRTHPEIKYKTTHSWYKVYGDCAFVSLISQCTAICLRAPYAISGTHTRLWYERYAAMRLLCDVRY